MRTHAQIEASRLNGAKSRGPITPEGKSRSSRNATRHGVLSNAIILKPEHHEPFRDHTESFRAEFNPQGPLETALVEKMAIARWRQISIWSLESAVMSGTVETLNEINPAVAEMDAQRITLELCLRYDGRFDRQYNHALDRLLRLRTAKTHFSAERTQHFIQNKASTRENEPAEGENNGFVSVPEAISPAQFPGSGAPAAAIGARPASR